MLLLTPHAASTPELPKEALRHPMPCTISSTQSRRPRQLLCRQGDTQRIGI